jgi:hypothetical protein
MLSIKNEWRISPSLKSKYEKPRLRSSPAFPSAAHVNSSHYPFFHMVEAISYAREAGIVA